MTHKANSVAIALLKTASAASSAMEVGERIGRAAKGLTQGAANLGGGLARGVGLPTAVGQAAGVGVLGAGALVGGRKAKRKAEELKFRLMYGDPGAYY